MKNKTFFYTTLITIAVFLPACSGTTASPTQSPQAAAPSLAGVLANTEYLLETTGTGKVPLQDGYYEEPSAPDSAAMIQVRLDQEIFGDINTDGMEDAVVTLIVESGGSGTFTYLAPVLNENGTPKPLPSVFLGDRIVVNTITIQPNTVTVDLLTHDSGESMGTEPTIEKTLTFTLQDDQLIPMD